MRTFIIILFATIAFSCEPTNIVIYEDYGMRFELPEQWELFTNEEDNNGFNSLYFRYVTEGQRSSFWMQSKYDSLNLHEEMNRLTSILARTYKEQNINYSLEPPKQSNLSGLSTITVNYQISNSDGFEAIGTINLLLCRTGTIMIGEERTTGFAMSEHSAAFSKLLESFTCN